jgi:hypothetical protein
MRRNEAHAQVLIDQHRQQTSPDGEYHWIAIALLGALIAIGKWLSNGGGTP